MKNNDCRREQNWSDENILGIEERRIQSMKVLRKTNAETREMLMLIGIANERRRLIGKDVFSSSTNKNYLYYKTIKTRN